MLKSLRNNTKLIVWIVVIAFVLGGGYSIGDIFFGNNKEQRAAGKVFGKEVSFQEFNRFYRASQLFASSEKPIEDPNVLRQSAWQGLILSREAQQRKIEVSNEEVRKNILELLTRQNIPVDNYEPWLERGLRTTPQDFESQVREILRIQKLIETLKGPGAKETVTEEEARKQFLSENKKLAVETLSFKDKKEAEAFRAKIKNAKDWAKIAEKKKEEIRKAGLVPPEILPMMFQISSEDAEKLHTLEIGTVSEPLTSGEQFAIFYISDKTFADEKKFDTEKETYIKSLKEQKIQNGLMNEMQDIVSRAKLQDYQPSEESSS